MVGGGVLVAVCRSWWWVLVGDGGRWLPLGDGAGGRGLPFVGSVGGCSSPLVAGAGACTWVMVAVCGCWWWVAVVRWWPLLQRVVVAGHSQVVGVGTLVFVWGTGVLLYGGSGGILQLVRHCCHLFFCHTAGSDVTPGKGGVRERGAI